MKVVLLMLAVAALAIAPLCLRGTREVESKANAQRLERVEHELAQAQEDLGELKQEIQILLKRDLPDD